MPPDTGISKQGKAAYTVVSLTVGRIAVKSTSSRTTDALCIMRLAAIALLINYALSRSALIGSSPASMRLPPQRANATKPIAPSRMRCWSRM